MGCPTTRATNYHNGTDENAVVITAKLIIDWPKWAMTGAPVSRAMSLAAGCGIGPPEQTVGQVVQLR
jgi:hypothetical protein